MEWDGWNCWDTSCLFLCLIELCYFQKPYKCGQCGKDFRQKAILDQHTRTHQVVVKLKLFLGKKQKLGLAQFNLRS